MARIQSLEPTQASSKAQELPAASQRLTGFCLAAIWSSAQRLLDSPDLIDQISLALPRGSKRPVGEGRRKCGYLDRSSNSRIWAIRRSYPIRPFLRFKTLS